MALLIACISLVITGLEGYLLTPWLIGSGKPDEPCGGFRKRAVLGLVVRCVGFTAGRTHHHDYQGGMRSGGRF